MIPIPTQICQLSIIGYSFHIPVTNKRSISEWDISDIGSTGFECYEYISGTSDTVCITKISSIALSGIDDIYSGSSLLSRYECSGCEEDSELFSDGTDDTGGVVGGCGMDSKALTPGWSKRERKNTFFIPFSY